MNSIWVNFKTAHCHTTVAVCIMHNVIVLYASDKMCSIQPNHATQVLYHTMQMPPILFPSF